MTGASLKPRAYVYIDGFNLYYNALKRTPYRWLNVQAMAQALFPEYDVVAVKYFTARVGDHKHNGADRRQQVYLRALATLPKVEAIFGNFLQSQTRMPLYPLTSPVRTVAVLKTEEKGSDVNIAAHMLCDAFDNLYDVALLFSNDSDLTLPTELVRQKFGKKVFIVTRTARPSRSLLRAAGFHRQLRQHHLQNNLLPQQLTDHRGTFTCPADWT